MPPTNYSDEQLALDTERMRLNARNARNPELSAANEKRRLEEQNPLTDHRGQGLSHQHSTGRNSYHGESAEASGIGGGHHGLGLQDIVHELNACIKERGLHEFYPTPDQVQRVARHVLQTGLLPQLAQQWEAPTELIIYLARLALFEIKILWDDSGSMAFMTGVESSDDSGIDSDGGNGKSEIPPRIKEGLKIVKKIARIICTFDESGIDVRSLSYLSPRLTTRLSSEQKPGGENLTMPRQVIKYIETAKYTWAPGVNPKDRYSNLRQVHRTPLGTSIHDLILEPYVDAATSRDEHERPKKPLLTLILSDGAADGEDEGKDLLNVLLMAFNRLSRTKYGSLAATAGFGQIGDVKGVMESLQDIDEHRVLDPAFDATSAFKIEAKQWKKNGLKLTPDLWTMKFILAPVSIEWDVTDQIQGKGKGKDQPRRVFDAIYTWSRGRL
ncbi:hypothetical protein JCM11641_002058 [Rhodosporidiobolus odoratus]